MSWWRRARALVRPRILRRAQDERDLDDEIRFDLAEETRLRIERGDTPESARVSAARDFGRVAIVKEDTRASWGWTFPDRAVQDMRFALRSLGKSPGFTVTAVLTLALGIGLCSFLFSALNGLVLQPLPGAREPERLVALQGSVPYPYFEAYRDESRTASSVAAFIGPVPFRVALQSVGDARPDRIVGHLVSPEYFSTLGAEPSLGRFFDPNVERRGAEPRVVVSERFWRTRLDADPRALGRSLRVNGQPATIVGVAQRDFLGLFPISPADIFVPVTADPAIAPELAGDVFDNAARPLFRVVLRLAPGVTMADAEAALDMRTRRLDQQAGKHDPEKDAQARLVRLMPGGSVIPWPTELRAIAILLFGLVTGLIFSFTCANLAGLVLARGSARGPEIAIRLSLGASRLRVVGQLLTESVILAVMGGAAGLAAAYALLALLTRSLAGSAPFPFAVHLTPDLPVAGLAFLVSALAGAGFGLMPALAATRPDLVTDLKRTSTTGLGRHRRFGLRNLFMVYQMAAAMALVVIMGFMVTGIQRGGAQDPGFDTSDLYLFSLDPARDGYSPDQSAAMVPALLEQLAQVHGVDGVTVADGTPFRPFVLSDTTMSVPPIDAGSPEETHRVAVQTIGPRFFAVLGAPVLQGEEFGNRELRSDHAADIAQPAVINHTAATELFGDANPLGRLIRHDQNVLQVAGVVRYGSPPPFRSAPAAMVFLPFTTSKVRQAPGQEFAVVVRAREGLGVADIGRELEATSSRLTISNLRTLQAHLAQMSQPTHYATAMYGMVGLFALVLACVGLAGVTAHAAMRRRQEIGIRMALGARRPQVLRLLMTEGAAMVTVGSVLGLAAAVAIARALASVSPQVPGGLSWSTTDPALTLAAPVLLIAVAAIACYLPARRAATVDPLVSLRDE